MILTISIANSKYKFQETRSPSGILLWVHCSHQGYIEIRHHGGSCGEQRLGGGLKWVAGSRLCLVEALPSAAWQTVSKHLLPLLQHFHKKTKRCLASRHKSRPSGHGKRSPAHATCGSGVALCCVSSYLKSFQLSKCEVPLCTGHEKAMVFQCHIVIQKQKKDWTKAAGSQIHFPHPCLSILINPEEICIQDLIPPRVLVHIYDKPYVISFTRAK